jgi:hypothetical protein
VNSSRVMPPMAQSSATDWLRLVSTKQTDPARALP